MMIFRVVSNRRMYYTASLHLRVELRRKKKRNKPYAFRKTSHNAFCARVGIGNECALARKYLALSNNIVWLPVLHQVGIFRAFQYTVYKCKFVITSLYPSIVIHQRRIRQCICEARKRNADSLRSLMRGKCKPHKTILTIFFVCVVK